MSRIEDQTRCLLLIRRHPPHFTTRLRLGHKTPDDAARSLTPHRFRPRRPRITRTTETTTQPLPGSATSDQDHAPTRRQPSPHSPQFATAASLNDTSSARPQDAGRRSSLAHTPSLPAAATTDHTHNRNDDAAPPRLGHIGPGSRTNPTTTAAASPQFATAASPHDTTSAGTWHRNTQVRSPDRTARGPHRNEEHVVNRGQDPPWSPRFATFSSFHDTIPTLHRPPAPRTQWQDPEGEWRNPARRMSGARDTMDE